MIRYRFNKGIYGKVAFFEDDLQAEEFAKFIDATWERDTKIFRIKENGQIWHFEVEIGDKDLSELNLKFKNFHTIPMTE
jgi:hypothetical protein